MCVYDVHFHNVSVDQKSNVFNIIEAQRFDSHRLSIKKGEGILFNCKTVHLFHRFWCGLSGILKPCKKCTCCNLL